MDKFLVRSKSAKKNSVIEKESVTLERKLAQEKAEKKSAAKEKKSQSPTKI